MLLVDRNMENHMDEGIIMSDWDIVAHRLDELRVVPAEQTLRGVMYSQIQLEVGIQRKSTFYVVSASIGAGVSCPSVGVAGREGGVRSGVFSWLGGNLMRSLLPL